MLVYSPDRVEIAAVTAEPGFLVLGDTYFRGWRAFVNGQETPIYRANSPHARGSSSGWRPPDCVCLRSAFLQDRLRPQHFSWRDRSGVVHHLFRASAATHGKGKTCVTALRIIAWLCYVSLTLSQLSLPGLEYDEVFFGPVTLGRTQDFSAPSTLEPAARVSPLASTAFLWRVGDYALPVMLMPYWGAVKVYLQAPVLALWGASPWAIRLPAIVLGAFTLLLFERLCSRVFSRAVTLLALLLLASDPSFVFYVRHDFGGAALTLFLVLAPLWFLVRWRETAQGGLWSLAFFLFGFGLYHRVDYLGFLAAVASVAIAYRLFPTLWGFSSSPRAFPASEKERSASCRYRPVPGNVAVTLFCVAASGNCLDCAVPDRFLSRARSSQHRAAQKLCAVDRA